MRAFATATLLISPAITLAATCSQSNGETKLPSWYISSTDPVGTKFTDPELVYIPTVAAFQKLGETDLGTKPATQECRANEKCYYSGSPICLDDAAKTLWIGPVLIYASTLDYVLPNCTRGNLNSNDKPLRSFAKELTKIIEEKAPIPTGCSQPPPPPPPPPPPSPSRTSTTTGGGGGGNGASITLGPLVLTASSAPAEREVGMWGVVAGLLAAAVGLGVVGGL